jgi:hypothetical protein
MSDKGDKTEVLSPKETVDLLMKKYAVIYSALLMRATSFTSHVRNNQLVATLMIAIVSLTVQFDKFKLQNETKRWWVLLTLFVIAVTYYLWYDTLDAHFAVVSHSARIKSLEDEINKIVWKKNLNVGDENCTNVVGLSATAEGGATSGLVHASVPVNSHVSHRSCFSAVCLHYGLEFSRKHRAF